MINIKETPETLSFSVLAVPNASRTLIAGDHEGALKIKLAAPPVDNKANRLCVKHLAKQLGVPKSAVEITAGHNARKKQIRIDFSAAAAGKTALKRVKSILAEY